MRSANLRPARSCLAPAFVEGPALVRLLLLALLIVLLGGAVFLVAWDIPAPTRQVETVIPDDRLPR